MSYAKRYTSKLVAEINAESEKMHQAVKNARIAANNHDYVCRETMIAIYEEEKVMRATKCEVARKEAADKYFTAKAKIAPALAILQQCWNDPYYIMAKESYNK